MAITVTVADFRTEFPEFASELDASIQRALDVAILYHRIRKKATLYAAAHVLSYHPYVQTGGGSSMGGTTGTGQLSRKRVGPLEVEYETHSGTTTNSNNSKSSTDVAYFSGTTYGMTFLALEQRSPRAAIGAMVVA